MSVNIQTSSGLVKIAGTPTIDTALSNVSKNPVQNKVITEKFDEINASLSVLPYNLIDLTNVVNNMNFDTSDIAWTTTDYIFVKGQKSLSVCGKSFMAENNIEFYDELKNTISKVAKTFENITDFPIPDNAFYCRITIRKYTDANDLSTVMLCCGNVEPNTQYRAFNGNPLFKVSNDVDEINASLSNLCYPNAGSHNAIYRGKYLGNSVKNEQWNAIKNGTFEDLYIGDYWTIGGVAWRIAGFDYWLNCGDAQCTKHHVVIVPDTCLYNAQMNTANVTTEAYIGSAMYKTNLAQAKTTINNAFGSSHILSHREYLANATKSTADPTYESTGSWYDSTVELMNERMVYGADVLHNIEVNGTIPTNYTIDKCQLPLFALEPSRICNRANWWLRDVVSAAYFAIVTAYGHANLNNASNSIGVRPAFGITVN